ncbi:MAG: 2-amino-4-hydroxy-6-hydroxymethyldihydropteridine diphosphokinase [Acidobacteria bacterium]|jgi:2-amino-4-hydroxy-6-hydroxymethyldihydropteridine diphosphokinase|nr:2-amino-4-hydroxy-6-hydroxymethyldihydropteridine diphosphokinase [Acidobacteriota bacterium]MBK9528920.1 2-amino-4-hydroxy-6-hydroxymethyldihydropteridine diphosphokinase [Acidobacteriota bacterium]MBP7475258.1 2-amino-4-hydroxy-6-hydroxymethyldihydropteridine diphosphokinase [Pyrinomonadaceae bacterium]MBP9109327.1 2-amino-4-hydroxy-6-hydroxymethyldihydropteridine diphosphokinase [Pyrinomonadaceae bacterium]
METTATTAYIGLGSNLGDRAGNLLLAVRCMLEASFDVVRLSSIYETEPVGLDTDLMFLNMVAEVRVSNISHTQMMARLLRIEYLLGRGDKTIKKPRTVDLDILLFGEIVVESEFLILPHPRLHLRKFVLVPLNEIAPTLYHPVLDMAIADILAHVDDISEVIRWDPNSNASSEPLDGNC